MKNKVKLALYSMLITTFLCGFEHQASGQQKMNFTTGIGFPELLNFGMSYQLNQVQLGLSYGFLPSFISNSTSISADMYYHFGGHSELSTRHPWYARLGLVLFQNESNDGQFQIGSIGVEKYHFINTRFGRDFNISKKVGIKVDAGLIFRISQKKTGGVSQSSENWDFPILPSFGMGLFYRI